MNINQEQSVSVIIPAFNEEGNIREAIDGVVGVLAGLTQEYEIIVVDDGSIDGTYHLAVEKSRSNPRIHVVRNDCNQGFGFSFARGVSLARMNYVTVFPGDNDVDPELLGRLLEKMDVADIVTSHPINRAKRSILRRALSQGFVHLMNFLFGLHLKYYNGAFVTHTALIRCVPIKSQGLTALAECLVRLIKAGYSYSSIPFEHVGRQREKSKALHFKSIIAVTTPIFVLWKDIHFSVGLIPEKPVCSI